MKPNDCFYCGAPTFQAKNDADSANMNRRTRDHLTPRIHGGATVPHNIVIACQMCNGDKSHLTVDEYRIVLAWRRHKFNGEFRAMLLAEAERVQSFWGDEQLKAKKMMAAWEDAQGEPDWKR